MVYRVIGLRVAVLDGLDIAFGSQENGGKWGMILMADSLLIEWNG
jgi:hypothetical protein